MKHWLVAIDPLVRRFGLYTSYKISKDEYVGQIASDSPRNDLEAIGYEPSPTVGGVPLQAAKTHHETGDVHDLSLRKVDPENERMQYHVHVWDDEVYSHHEYRPDFQRVADESHTDRIERLKTHYRPEWDTDEYTRGKACDELLSALED